MAVSKIQINKLSQYLTVHGFANREYISVKNLSTNAYYGIAKVITQFGEKTIQLNGYDSTQTDTSGNIKTYKHNDNGVLDIQFVFSSKYTHGVLILGGSVTNGIVREGIF